MPATSSGSLSLFKQARHFIVAQTRCLYNRKTILPFIRINILVVLLFVSIVSGWTLFVPTAYAAASKTIETAPIQQSQEMHTPAQTAQPQTETSNVSTTTVKPQLLSGSNPFDGLGQLPFYTYVKHPINSPSCACGKQEMYVNVADGNLLFHTVDLQIHGTGLNLSIESFYNSLANYNYFHEHGKKWNFNIGRDVYLDLTNASTAGIIFYGPSNFSAYFARNSDGTYKDAPGLNATLKNTGGGTYGLTFHQSGLRLLFGVNTSLSSIKDKNNNTIRMAYASGAPDQTDSLTDTQGRVINFTQDASGRVTAITDPGSRSVTYTYDSTNHLTSETDLAGKTTTYSYTGDNITQVTDALNKVTSITYDTIDHVTSITDPNGGKTTFSYSPGVTVVTDANAHSTTYTFDNRLKVTSTKDALGHTSSSTFDATNYNVTQTQDALSNTNTFTFDVNNNATSATDGAGNKSTATYNNTSLPYYPDSSTDANNNTLSYAYDANGNLTSTTDQLATQNNEKYTYNANGTMSSMTDANANKTTYGYDSNGNLTSVTPPSPLGGETLTQDSLSRVTSVTDGKNQKTSFSYNALDRITQITYADNSTINYSYDANGNLASVVDNTGTTTFSYDALNRMTQKTLPGSVSLSYTYDKVGNLTSLQDAGGTVSYAYNEVNLLTTLTDPANAKTTYIYDNINRRTKMTYPNGVSTAYTYDGAGHPTSIKATTSSATVMSFTYTYTGGRKASVTDVNNNPTYYSYDALNRLTEALVKNSTGTQINDFKYTYDGAGNRLSALASGVTTTFSYNTANELTSSVVGGVTTTYSYDANGNMTNDAGLSFSYNAKNQTTAISSDSYTYSGADSTDRVQANGTTFRYTGLGLSSASNSGGQTYYTRDNQGQLVSMRTTSGTYYYHLNALGSVSVLTDSSGTVKNTYAYDPWGNSLAKTEAVANPWQFAAGYYDATTGLYKFGTRYYDPKLGRWTQQDPVGGSLGGSKSGNRYIYVDDNPVTLTDPSGRFPAALALGLIGCAGGAFGNFAQLVASQGPKRYTPSAGVTIKTLITGCVIGAAAGLVSIYAFATGPVALTAETATNAGGISAISGAVSGLLYGFLGMVIPD